MMPADRRTALWSQRSPKSSSRVPTRSFSAESGIRVTMNWPNRTTRTARETRATAVPRRGARQPRVSPTASTIVRASVDSTAEPRNAAPKMKSCWYIYGEIIRLPGFDSLLAPHPTSLSPNGERVPLPHHSVISKPGIYPDDSIIRRVNRENVLMLGGGRALLMQLAHPKVAAGVDEHSDFRAHPIRRLRRTIRMTMAIVFGDRETALAAARTVNQVHTRVRGRDYHALDPDLLLWVHATLMDTALVTYETFVQPLIASEREDFYQEFK